MVSQLRDENSEQRVDVCQWGDPCEWQAGATASASNQPLDPKSAAPCRFGIVGADAEEDEEDAQRTLR